MRCLIRVRSIVRAALDAFSCRKIYQVRTGNQSQWMTADEWHFENKQRLLTKINYGDTYGNTRTNSEFEIESVATLPLSSSSRNAYGAGET